MLGIFFFGRGWLRTDSSLILCLISCESFSVGMHVCPFLYQCVCVCEVLSGNGVSLDSSFRWEEKNRKKNMASLFYSWTMRLIKLLCLFCQRSLSACLIGGEGCYHQTSRIIIPQLLARICFFIINLHMKCVLSDCVLPPWLICTCIDVYSIFVSMLMGSMQRTLGKTISHVLYVWYTHKCWECAWEGADMFECRGS